VKSPVKLKTSKGIYPELELTNALFKGDLSGVKYWIDKVSKFDRRIAFTSTARKPDKVGLPLIKFLLEHCSDVINANDKHLALYNAASQSKEAGFLIVKYLVENGVNPKNDHDSALIEAARRRNIRIVTYLIENGAGIE
jgi:hypothetical protein